MKLPKFVPTRWSDIRRIQEIKLISSMYIWIFLVPIAVKLLSRVEEIPTVKIFEYEFEIPLSLPFSWKVFYFSAIFFALAALLHRIKGPRLIHDHPTFASFREEKKADWQLRSYAEEIGVNYDNFINDLENNMEEHDGKVSVGEEYSQTVFWHLYWEADKSRSNSFMFTLFFYFIGFLLIGIVVLENLIWVVKYMFPKAFGL